MLCFRNCNWPSGTRCTTLSIFSRYASYPPHVCLLVHACVCFLFLFYLLRDHRSIRRGIQRPIPQIIQSRVCLLALVWLCKFALVTSCLFMSAAHCTVVRHVLKVRAKGARHCAQNVSGNVVAVNSQDMRLSCLRIPHVQNEASEKML